MGALAAVCAMVLLGYAVIPEGADPALTHAIGAYFAAILTAVFLR